MFQRAERVAYVRVQIAHSCIVHSRKFSVPVTTALPRSVGLKIEYEETSGRDGYSRSH